MAKKTNKPRNKRANRSRRGNRSRRARAVQTIPHNLVERVCSNYDPFCQMAMGAKMFDENTVPSLTYQNRMVVGVNTDANGVALVWVNPSVTQYVNTATIVAGAVNAWTTSDTNFAATVGTSGIHKWRVVSSGVRFFTTQAWTTASGYINVTEATDTFNSAVVGQTASSVRLGPRMKSLPLRDAKFTMVHRSKGMQARTYRDYTDLDSGYSGTILYFNGTASTLVGYFEVITNFEWLPDAGTQYQYYTTPAAPSVPLIMDSVAKMASQTDNIKTITDGVSSAATFFEQAKNAVHQVSGMIDNIADIGGTIYPPLRGISGVSHAINALTG